MTEWLDVSATTPRIGYTATASQTVFAVPFVFFADTDLAVYVNGTLKTLTTQYTAAGAEDENGGTVTFLTGLSASDAVLITRVMAYDLTTHIPTSGQLDVAAINLQFSRFVAMLQQTVADQPRSLRQPDADADDLDELPVAASRASKYLAFDADGQPIVVASVSSAVAASAFMLTLLDDANAAAARATLGITSTDTLQATFNWQNFR